LSAEYVGWRGVNFKIEPAAPLQTETASRMNDITRRHGDASVFEIQAYALERGLNNVNDLVRIRDVDFALERTRKRLRAKLAAKSRCSEQAVTLSVKQSS